MGGGGGGRGCHVQETFAIYEKQSMDTKSGSKLKITGYFQIENCQNKI